LELTVLNDRGGGVSRQMQTMICSLSAAPVSLWLQPTVMQMPLPLPDWLQLALRWMRMYSCGLVWSSPFSDSSANRT
jgi:hypothetical protein